MMAGLTREGFTALSYQELKKRISTRLNTFSPGIDLSTESPDGQLVEIFSFELAQAWNELDLVYNSYNPNIATGAGLRNIGLISGLPYGAATRSQVTVELGGTAGTIVPKGSIAANMQGKELVTTFDAIIPSSVLAVAKTSGGVSVGVGEVSTVISAVSGWDTVNNPVAGLAGSVAQTEPQYRNLRNKTVMRNHTGVEEVIRARLLEELGIEQTAIVNNDSLDETDPDGTPPQTIHVVIGEIENNVTDLEIARVILRTKGLGCPTYGTTEVVLDDSQGNPHKVRFSKATTKNIFVSVEVKFLDSDSGGATESIREALVEHINSLAAEEDIVWSRLFGLITPYAKAQVNKLELSTDGDSFVQGNIDMGASEYAYTEIGYINVVVAE